MENIIESLRAEPIVSFSVLLAVILIVPILFERLRLPGIIGLLLSGILLGPNALKLLNSESQIMILLSDIGLLYLMFVAGLEIDIEQFHRVKYRSAGFGSLTFAVPLITGTIIGRFFEFDWNSSILLGSLLASHTLLAYPIVSRLGVVNNEAVVVTVAGTIFTDIGALIVLAICVGISKGDFTIFSFLTLIGGLAIYTLVVLFGFDWAGREFFRRSGADEGNQFLFVLLAVFLAAFGAEWIGVEKIVGAFLAGLAVNDALGEGPVKEKVIFVGSVLFIPIFFVDIGLLINLPAFVSSLSSVWLSLAIVTGLLFSKFAAAFLTKLIYRYNWHEMLTIWSLSIPQVAATLAAALVGNRAGLLSDDVLNSVVVMMVVTSTLSPLIISRSARELSVTTEAEQIIDTALFNWKTGSPEHPFTVIVPIANPQTEQYLIEMAALIARHENGRIVPLVITLTYPHLDTTELQEVVNKNEALLEKAVDLSKELSVKAEPLLRIDDQIAQGISRASQEQKASLIVMGWGKRAGFRARLFGNVIDSVFWSAHCPVAVTRLLASPKQIRRILVPIENFSQRVSRKVYFTQILADANQAEVTLLRVCDRRFSTNQKMRIKTQMESLISESAFQPNIETKVISNNDVVKTILNESKQFDLVVLNSQRYLTNAEGVVLSNTTNKLVQQLTCSVIVLGEPKL